MKDCVDCNKLYVCKDDKCSNWPMRQEIQKQWDDDALADWNTEMYYRFMYR